MEEEFPVILTLRFRSEAARAAWVGGMLDGWGEDGPWEIANWDDLPNDQISEGPWDLIVYSQEGEGHWSEAMEEVR